jgi:NAD(P)-dependent dehydrogenase (short-subunit alcohol dehydrogenase family)
MKMKDKVVIVTGAANGIGREIAFTFAREGSDLCIVDIDEENLKLTSQAIERMGRSTLRSKTVDVLINCAALIVYENFLDFNEDVWRRILDVNLCGYFIFSQAVARKMVEKGNGGRIISIASVAADFGHRRAAAYSASKAGVVALTKAMALELGQFGINVTAISPGPIATDQVHKLLTEEEKKQRARMTALGRYGEPSDVANAALFLASEDAKYITGSVLRVDAGVSWTRT